MNNTTIDRPGSSSAGPQSRAREPRSPGGDMRSHFQSNPPTSRLAYPGLISLLAGFAGTTVVAIAAVVTPVLLLEGVQLWTGELVAVVLGTRLLYLRTTGHRPLLTDYGVRRDPGQLLREESTLGMTWLAASFLLQWELAPATALICVGMNLLLQATWYLFAQSLMRRLKRNMSKDSRVKKRKQALVLGTGMRAQAQVDILLDTPELDTAVVGLLDFDADRLWRYRDVPLIGHPGNLKDIVGGGQVDSLFVAVEPEKLADVQEVLWTAEQMGIPVAIMPDLYPGWVTQARPSQVGKFNCLVYRQVPESKAALFLKDVTDRAGALVGLTLAAPIMLVCALLIKLESRGPVFFTQTRSGENGKEFKLIKFRTMCVDAERKKAKLRDRNEMSGPVFKIKQDPRVTRIGRFLRKYSLDELPQFFNVLRGDMSLVGPRPPIPHEVKGFEAWQRRKLSVKPGLTCLWQVNGRNAVDFEEWMHLDLKYIDNWSLWQDARIIMKTVPAVLKGSGM